jgi:hypothetical protein
MKILLACIALLFGAGALAADEGLKPPAGRGVVLSEFSILPAPGPEGTWIELYNRSPRAVDMGKASLVCNGARLVTFPISFPVPGRSLVLVRFVKPHAKPWDVVQLDGNTQLVRVPALVPVYTGRHRVRPGFLALERAVPNGLDQLADYVRWGRFPLGSDESYPSRAVQAGVWDRFKGKPLYVGLSPTDVEMPFPRGDMLLKRVSFDPQFDKGEAWVLLELATASPGKPNLSLPAPELGVLDGAAFLEGQGLNATCKMPYSFSSDRVVADGVFRFEIARDPQFEESVATGESPKPAFSFPAAKLPSGTYYLRCQWQRKGVCTLWTAPVFVRVQ